MSLEYASKDEIITWASQLSFSTTLLKSSSQAIRTFIGFIQSRSQEGQPSQVSKWAS